MDKEKASEIIKIWEKKQEDLLFQLLLGESWKGPFRKGRLIIKNIINPARFFVAEDNGLILEEDIIFNDEIVSDKLILNIPEHKDFIFRLRQYGYQPMQILTKDIPSDEDVYFSQHIMDFVI
jgi:hypothetical protein